MNPSVLSSSLPVLMALTPVIVSAQGNPNVPRTHFPDLRDPELDGGTPDWFSRGEVTPDGRLILAFRRMVDDPNPEMLYEVPPERMALTVATVDAEAFRTNASNHLLGFSEQVGVVAGEDYVFGEEGNAQQGTGDWFRIHWGFELEEFDSSNHNGITPISMAGSPYWSSNEPSLVFNHDFPVPFNDFGSSMISVAMRSTYGKNHPLEGQSLPGNPYPSDLSGAFVPNGSHTTYHLWVVRLHAEDYVDPNGNVDLDVNMDTNGNLVVTTNDDDGKVLACQDLTVVIDGNDQVVSAEIQPFSKITTAGGGLIKALEPTVTADGKLIVFNGSGAQTTGIGRVTYIYNQTGCATTDWTTPDTIAQAPDVSLTEFTDIDDFKRRYRIFMNPIQMPPSPGLPNGYVFGDESVHGPYPWISRDGSFYIAGGAHSDEAKPGEAGRRAGTYVVGDLTGGFIKYIDDNGVNPTRHGGPWTWPLHKAQNNPSSTKPSERSVIISPGLSPGMWELQPEKDPPFPTQVASKAIPVMPVIFTISDSYGEIRFEDADGHYLLYLPCNESLAGAPSGNNGADVYTFDVTSTQDTSGRSTRGYGKLNAGAAFPREVYENSGFDATTLRQDVGSAYGQDLEFNGNGTYAFGALHENVGFRGQGIVMNESGRVRVFGTSEGLAGKSSLTLQLFVKFLKSKSSMTTLLKHEAVHPAGTPFNVAELFVSDQGFAGVTLLLQETGTTTIAPLTFMSTVELSQNSSLANNKEGWHHLAVTFDGSSVPDQTTVTIWVDGEPEDTVFMDSMEIPTAPETWTHRTLVGPAEGSPVPVQLSGSAGALLVVDEVALSDVVRTEREIKRDAHVELPGDGLETAPTELAALLPAPFELADVQWPAGAPDYDVGIVDLGRDLFADTILGSPVAQRSCASCHVPPSFAFEGQQTAATLMPSNPLLFNTPTLLNAGLGGHKTFSGKAATLEEQVLFPLESPAEMGNGSVQQALNRLIGSSYEARFDTYFTDGVTADNLASSLAMYMRTLYDGNTTADTGSLSSGAAEGKALFFGKARCASCHTGPNFTDDDFHNINSVTNGSIEDRKSVTGRQTDRGALKTPTLRSLEHTGPYFHDGSKATLLDVVTHYNDPEAAGVPNGKGTPDRHLRPLDLTPYELARLVEYLEALSNP